MSVEGCGCPPDECRSVGAEGCYFGFAPADDVFAALEAVWDNNQPRPADLPVGVNGEGSRLSSHGADDAPDEPKGRCSRNDPAPTGTHECVFVEEQEPPGRLVLPPCIVCGFTAMDALDRLRGEVS